MKITSIKAREILDSRGVPTLETKITLDDGTTAKGAVPSGASTGTTEVLELRDGDKSRYFGKGTLKAVENVNEIIAKALEGKEFDTQAELDRALIELDGTTLKEKLGGNAILSVSMAFCRAMADSQKIPLYEHFAKIYWGEDYSSEKLTLPRPMMLIMEGGAHGNWSTDFQEYMISPMPGRFPNLSETVRAGAEIFKATHDLLVDKGYSATVGYEGAYAPTQIRSNTEAFEILAAGVEKAGYSLGTDFVYALDIASSEFYDSNSKKYVLKREGLSLDVDEWIAKLSEWMETYPIWSIEDPLNEDAWDKWSEFTTKFGDRSQIVGDDFLTTNVSRIHEAIERKSVNSVLIKLNQIGTVSETLAAIKLTTRAGYEAIVSHRGGETNDDMIADLVVGTNASQSKFGAPSRGERVAKYNRLTEIESEIG